MDDCSSRRDLGRRRFKKAVFQQPYWNDPNWDREFPNAPDTVAPPHHLPSLWNHKLTNTMMQLLEQQWTLWNDPDQLWKPFSVGLYVRRERRRFKRTPAADHNLLRDFNTNNIHGTIPPSIQTFTKAQYFYLYGNRLTGSIPPQIGNLASLTNMSALLFLLPSPSFQSF